MKRPRLTIPDYLLALLFGATIFIVTAQVVFRYVFNNSLTWSEELSRYLFTWMIFLGAACALRDGGHIRIETFADMVPARMKRALRVLNRLLIIVFLELAIVLGITLVRHTSGTRSPALSLPVNIVYYASLPAAFLLGLYYEIRRCVRFVRSRERDTTGDNDNGGDA